jgi:hypothetical protein
VTLNTLALFMECPNPHSAIVSWQNNSLDPNKDCKPRA